MKPFEFINGMVQKIDSPRGVWIILGCPYLMMFPSTILFHPFLGGAFIHKLIHHSEMNWLAHPASPVSDIPLEWSPCSSSSNWRPPSIHPFAVWLNELCYDKAWGGVSLTLGSTAQRTDQRMMRIVKIGPSAEQIDRDGHGNEWRWCGDWMEPEKPNCIFAMPSTILPMKMDRKIILLHNFIPNTPFNSFVADTPREEDEGMRRQCVQRSFYIKVHWKCNARWLKKGIGDDQI